MSQDPLGPVQISARDIYDELRGVRVLVERLADRLESTAQSVTDHEQRLRQIEDVRPGPRIQDIEARLRAVEARQWPLPTLSVLIALAALGLGLIQFIARGGS